MSICFQHEWRTPDGRLRAIPHRTTTNVSFLRMCSLLQRMGIKNCYFPLALYDPDLLTVDPHNLTEDTDENEILRTKVQKEAKRNGWYFLREICRIYEQGSDPVQFRLNRGSMAMAWCFINGIDYWSMQPRQTGKATTLDSLIRTPSGWVRMGDIKVGDDVVTPDGGNAPVVGVYPQGELDIFDMVFEDGRRVGCCNEHLWKVHWPHWGEEDGGKWRILTTNQIRMHMRTHITSNNRLSIQLIEPESKDDIDLPIDPYVMGVILGDGSITNDSVTICKPDQFIKDELDRLLAPHYRTSEWHSGCKSYTISASPGRRHMRHDLEALGLWDKIHDVKFIPEIYMNASPRQRWALVQGLMDTDGTVETPRLCADDITPKHGALEYSTTSPMLAKQFQELIRSLGGLCKLRKRQPYFTYKGEKKPGKPSYRLFPRVKDRSMLFRLPRKRDLTLIGDHKYQDSLKLAIRDIVWVGKKEAQCIEVGHPDHLYVTDDYIVTHNTVCAVTLSAWVLFCATRTFNMGMMAKDDSLRRENISRVKKIRQYLPAWWVAEDKYKDKNNQTEIYYAAFDTKYETMVAQKDKAAADLQARGASPSIIHFDEIAYCANIDISYPTMLSSTDTARDNAKKNGQPHSNIITTTAGDPTKSEARAAAGILDGAMPFNEQMYDIDNLEKLHEVVAAASPQKMINGTFSHLQLGYDNAWLRDKITRNKLTRDKVCRDYLNRWVSIQEEPIIPKEVLNIINASQREVSYMQMLSTKFVINWYIPKEMVESQTIREMPIILGCDSSEMIGRDATTLVGVNPTDLSTMLTFRCNEGNINVVGAQIAKLLLMFPKMVWVPENKSSGTALIDGVSLILRKEGHNPFTRIFNWVVNNRDQKEFAQINIRDTSLMDSAIKKYFGIKTDKARREELYSSVLIDAATMAAARIKDQTLISEMNALTVRNGRIDHASGGHDDTVFGWMMAMWFILNAKHMDIYGIRPGTAMSGAMAVMPNKDRDLVERQEKIRGKIEELELAIKNQRDPSMRRLMEGDLTLFKSMITNAATPVPLTADELTRDPRKFSDPVIAQRSRDPVNGEDMEHGLRMIMGLG